MLEINNLSFQYSEESSRLFQAFSFKAKCGETVLVKGSSGSGKTTLLNLLCGVIPKVIPGKLSGKITINDHDIKRQKLSELSPYISLLMQDPELQLFFPIVEQEIAFGPENFQVEPEEILSRISTALKLLGIEHLRYRETVNLSFGEKKLVALAALIALDPQIFLLDEPTAGISSQQIEYLKNVIKTLSENGKIFFIAEHQGELLDLPHLTIDLDDSGAI
ncbi:MAG: hypothetical protein APR54_05755 [Candidatus Cloacimonas sp. SDB]|nr:MAG: hypothetical protein APR54_05755 [Candidatus Cloacimonas sp. SDB]